MHFKPCAGLLCLYINYALACHTTFDEYVRLAFSSLCWKPLCVFKLLRFFYCFSVNGQPEEDKTKANTGGKTKSAKTPEGKPGRKKDRTPRKEIKV